MNKRVTIYFQKITTVRYQKQQTYFSEINIAQPKSLHRKRLFERS